VTKLPQIRLAVRIHTALGGIRWHDGNVKHFVVRYFRLVAWS
jgi:hypothetical protein